MVDPYSHPFPPYRPRPPNDTTRPVNGSYGWSRSHANHGNFDTNMVIILAALLCALICTLGLNSIIRFFLRISRRYPVETPDEAVRMPETGLQKRVLHQIPVEVYSSGISIPSTDCPICLGEFTEGEKLRVLPKCNHGFHVKCIDTWLVSHSSCPTCRHSLLETSPVGTHIDDGSGGGGGVVVIVDDMS